MRDPFKNKLRESAFDIKFSTFDIKSHFFSFGYDTMHNVSGSPVVLHELRA